MTTKVIFNVNPKVKAKAMANAKKQGITISDYLNFALVEFAEGERRVGIVETLNKKTHREVMQAHRDYKAGKNISPKFSTVEEGFAWLDRKIK